MPDFQQLFDAFGSVRVGVIGDVMLDTYMWGQVDRISPEAPVPVITLNKKEFRIGGAGNVALNCRSLGAQVDILSVTGDDENGRILRNLFLQHEIGTAGLTTSNRRITTNKTRIIGRNQQMMRVDEEITTDLDKEEETRLLNTVLQYLASEKPAVLIFEDYNKGVLTPRIIESVITACSISGIITAVDPKRKNFFAYRGADIFKPNLKEVKEALNLLSVTAESASLAQLHTALHERLQHKLSLITLSEKGIFYQQDNSPVLLTSHLRNIADVSGAGDTVIAVAALVYAITRNAALMAAVANIAGGLVCEEVGTVAVGKDALLKECTSLLA